MHPDTSPKDRSRIAPLLALATLLVLAALAAARDSTDPPAARDLAPPDVEARARRIGTEPDPTRRVQALRALADEAGEAAIPVLTQLLATDPSPAVRERAARSLRGSREPAALAALERAAASDADVKVVLRALEELQQIRLARLLDLTRRRLALSPPGSDPGARRALIQAEEHWLTVARGGLLPEFLRQTARFEALPPGGSFRLVAFGDFGSGEPDQLATAEAIRRFHAREPLDLGLTLGDNFYPRGVASPADPMWQAAWVKPYASLGIPFYATLGNHDWGQPDSPVAQILYDDPTSGWNLPAARYSFRAGPAQLFALDTTALSTAQIEWLDRELARSTATWNIVYGHHPIRSHGRYGDNADLVERLLPVLRGRADVYLAGHEHDLQVLEPEDGLHFVISGAGGKSIRPTRPGPRTRFSASAFGFTVLDVEPDRLRIRMVDRDLGVGYDAWIEPREASGSR